MKNFFLFALIFFSIQLIAQNTVKITISDVPHQPFTLASFYGDQNHVLDTIMPDTNGIIQFEMFQSYYDGMYRLGFNKDYYLDFIFGHEDIVMETNFRNLIDSMNVIRSMENEIYFTYLKKMRHYYMKLDLLTPLVSYYPEPRDSFYDLASEEYVNNQNVFIEYMEDVIVEHPSLWVSKILQQQIPIYIEAALNEQDRLAYIREHFFDNIRFDDADLIRSNIYNNKAIEYISFYSNQNLTQDQLEDEFIKAVDRIMLEASVNSIVYEFVIEYLVRGFETYHFDKVLDYIAEQYDPEQCENYERKTDLQTRLDRYAELSVGKEAPDFSNLNDLDQEIRLSKIHADYTLVLFWASWCPHCNDVIPKIHSLYTQTNKPEFFEVVTVSLDTARAEWVQTIEENQTSWINTCDSKGWDTQAAIDYNIYATPTMFLLDNKKKILAKPITYDGLLSDMLKLGIIKAE